MILAEPILITLFQYGELTSTDVNMSALSLQAYSIGLIAFMLVKVLAPGFYARKDTATPVKIGITAMVANMFLNLLLAFPLMYLWNIGHVGLALATSLAAILNAALLLRGLLRRGFYQVQPGWTVYLRRLLLACLCMVGVILWLMPEAGAWADWQWQRRIGELLLLCAIGVAVYFMAHGLLGTRMSHLRAPPAD
jgi:putative peptidoglycan lipid II flippase